MKTVVLIPYVNTLEFGLFDSSDSAALTSGTLHAQTGGDHLQQILRSIAHDIDQPVEAITNADWVIRLPYSGSIVPAPTRVDEALLESLEALVPDAPLHLPRCIELIRSCIRLTNAPVTVVSESSFFVNLPDEEATYAIDFNLQQQLHARRYGFHGIYHQHAAKQAAIQLGRHEDQPPKTISVCLEPRPELAAIDGTGPVMVSGGMTPLEGLCGLTACGDIDPGIVLQMVRSKGWDHERINRCLGRDSGMCGLAGRRVSWDDVFDEQDPQMQLARSVFKYHLLRYCGAAISSMGGVDAIVFSGRYNENTNTLADWLTVRLKSSLDMTPAILSDQVMLIDLVYEEALEAVDREPMRG